MSGVLKGVLTAFCVSFCEQLSKCPTTMMYTPVWGHCGYCELLCMHHVTVRIMNLALVFRQGVNFSSHFLWHVFTAFL